MPAPTVRYRVTCQACGWSAWTRHSEIKATRAEKAAPGHKCPKCGGTDLKIK